jgi:aspartyl protease family protein
MAHWEPDPDYDRPRRGRGGLFWAAVIIAAMACAGIVLWVAFPQVRPAGVDPARVVYMVGILALAIVTGGSMLRENPWRALGQLSIWLAIGCGLALAYTYRAELGFGPAPAAEGTGARPADSPRQPTLAATTSGDREVTLYAQGGHFFVEAEVEGRKITFMIDTGASDVALTQDDARSLGITPSEREFTRAYQTANGIARGAPVTLDSIAVGPIDLRNVEGSVVEGQMQVSLLGMSFLNRLSGYQVVGDRLILKQ